MYNPAVHGVVGGEMGRDSHVPAAAARGRPNPPWSQVAATTLRLWFERHSHSRNGKARNGRARNGTARNGRARQQPARERRFVLALSAIAAMALGALVTLALTQPASKSASPQPSFAAHDTTSAQLQAAAVNRTHAATWIEQQILPSAIIGCDAEMCSALEAAGVSAGRLYVFTPSTPDPLNATVVVATLALRNQFGPRLASVYAPLLIAAFGTGAEQVGVRVVEPGGTAAFEATLNSDLQARISAGQQLLTNKHLDASPQARTALLGGMVDPRLLVTLSALAAKIPVQLILFDDSSPGASPEVPLRSAEISASTDAGLAAIMGFLAAQRSDYQPSNYRKITIQDGRSVVAVQFDAPGPLGLNGT